jgi:Ca2+-binding EF-hand superfamily protein
MASDQNKQELVDKVSALVDAKFAGDYQLAFQQYDSNQDGKISSAELKSLLYDAGVGNALTRSAWASGIIAELDADGDGEISWSEFNSVISGRTK